MNFQQSVEYLYELGNEVSAMKLGLLSTEKLLAALGNPQNKYLKVQVAGTNGKGSTCAFLDAICRRAGVKTGLFTSPHLISITERIRINGEKITEENFARFATRIREISENLVEENELETVPTFFEQMTAIGACAFAETAVDLAILETGLGGRLDSVTALKAEIAAITPIDFDHQQILGATLMEIAAEKAAIIRADSKVVVAPEQSAEALNVIQKVCQSKNIKPIISDYQTDVIAVNSTNGRMVVNFSGEELYGAVELGLSGRHQISNARVAIAIAEILNKNFNFKIEKNHIEEGLERAQHSGRLEFYKGILFDGAHNIAGAKALRNFFDEFIKQPITLVFGAMRDKNLSDIAEILFPQAQILIFTEPDNSRSLQTGELMKFLPTDFDSDKVYQTRNVQTALKLARKLSVNENLICMTGSLYLVGEAQKLLNNNS